jgi:hypothetical protein
VQFGLTVSEIDAIEERLAKLPRDAEDGTPQEIRLFIQQSLEAEAPPPSATTAPPASRPITR